MQRLSDGKWWGGGTFSETDPQFIGATNTSPWQYTSINGSNLTSGASYYIVSQAWDNAGNIETSPPGQVPSTFIWDVTAPTTTVTSLVSGLSYPSLATISGTMADVVPFAGAQVSNIAAVTISIQDLTASSTYWLVGTGWVQGSQWNNTTIYSSSWTFTNVPV